jgi:hypothetical protein
MHPLPVRRNVAATDAVLDGKQSLIYEQAGGRCAQQPSPLARGRGDLAQQRMRVGDLARERQTRAADLAPAQRQADRGNGVAHVQRGDRAWVEWHRCDAGARLAEQQRRSGILGAVDQARSQHQPWPPAALGFGQNRPLPSEFGRAVARHRSAIRGESVGASAVARWSGGGQRRDVNQTARGRQRRSERSGGRGIGHEEVAVVHRSDGASQVNDLCEIASNPAGRVTQFTHAERLGRQPERHRARAITHQQMHVGIDESAPLRHHFSDQRPADEAGSASDENLLPHGRILPTGAPKACPAAPRF